GPTSHLLDQAEEAGVGYVRWGIEITDYMSTPDSTSSFGTLDLSPVASQIAAVHARSTPSGAPMGVVLAVLGVPRKVNSNAGSSDPASGGKYHWFATTSGGRTIVANYTVDVANLLDPAKDYIQMGNEISNGAFNHDGSSNPGPGVFGASAATVATQMAEQILAVRASGPSGLRIMSGSTINYGDINNPTDVATGVPAPTWVGNMLTGDPRLKNTGGDARPDIWTHHNYTGSAPPLSGWTLTASNDVAL